MVEISKSKSKVYKDFFAKNELVEEWNKKGFVFKTFWRRQESDNSFCLKEKYTDRICIPQILIDRFGIKDNDLFKEKYREATSGDGQEWTRITTLHSSSLIALLCFYSISESNPIQINGYTFTESYFEVKTQVFQDAKSNMDVVLRGRDKDGGKVVLFLECKFSEYLSTGKYDNISIEAYKGTYNELGLFKNDNLPFIVEVKKDKECICISSKKKPLYCGGIKQMLSHYIGVSNYSSLRENALAERKRFIVDKEEKVLLGEILFDFGDNITGEKLKNYNEAYSSLARLINSNNKIGMFEKVLTYQDVFFAEENRGVIKDDNIRKFYRLEK